MFKANIFLVKALLCFRVMLPCITTQRSSASLRLPIIKLRSMSHVIVQIARNSCSHPWYVITCESFAVSFWAPENCWQVVETCFMQCILLRQDRSSVSEHKDDEKNMRGETRDHDGAIYQFRHGKTIFEAFSVNLILGSPKMGREKTFLTEHVNDPRTASQDISEATLQWERYLYFDDE